MSMNILTFDIEEWFHLLNNPFTKSPKNWESFESRIDRNMEMIFQLLDDTNTKATFFVLGWIAKKYPHVVRKIDDLGYEIGSHTHTHQLIFEQGRIDFKKDLRLSIDLLENLTGKKVKMFRAPSFSITNESLWAFDVLAEEGIEIDCSIFPGNRTNGGLTSNIANTPFLVSNNGITLKEFPISYSTQYGAKTVFSGGGYFRLFPKSLISKLIKNNEYNMTYFHPRDFDYDQPRLKNLSTLEYFKSYVGLSNSLDKLEDMLNVYTFKDISYYDNIIDWDTKSTVEFE